MSELSVQYSSVQRLILRATHHYSIHPDFSVQRGSLYLPTRTDMSRQERLEKFYGDKKLSFNVFEYVIVSKYIFVTFLS